MMDFTNAQRLHFEVSEFLYREAEHLSDRNYQAWLSMLAEDFTYKLFIAGNFSSRSSKSDYLEGKLDVAWIDEGKDIIGKRVQQLATGQHWAEEPPSRTTRMISNIRIVDAEQASPDRQTVSVRYNFIINRVRNDDEDDYLSGRKLDILECCKGEWTLKSRKIHINQSVLLVGGLGFFV